ncbi:hypothetical protein CCAX7_009500 [Capsulimonas corticalis]|uniref:Uncharacterized protein n=1 Tax=Capsulimonas corticalis TaxID=2219043 RepID=A0A402CU96_9BACT|nr:S53 family peptidase [Capsulimonas corticalis]BDI28899.1 hypothetical protein CCAX7_009500 [Capsulimonas corticalis]
MPHFFQSLQRFSSLMVAVAAITSAAQASSHANIAVSGSPAARHGALMDAAAPASGETLHLVFALSSSRRADLDAFVQSQYDPSSPNYRHWLTPDEFGVRFGASDADIAAVTQYARSQGFAVTQVWPNRLFVSVDARGADAERAFGVKLHGYARPQSEIAAGLPSTFHAPDRAPALPPEIAARVAGLFGLSSENAARPALAKRGLAAEPAQSLAAAVPLAGLSSPATPSTLAAYYGFDKLHLHGFNGDNQSIAIFSPTHYSTSDFTGFKAAYGITGVTVTEVLVNGGATSFSGEDEAALDMDVIAGQAPNSHIYLYESPPDGNLQIWNKIAADNLPVVSCSWGNSEQELTADDAASVNTILQQMASQGQSVFVASGDNGAFDITSRTPSVDFPASSPYVTAVGGTSVSSTGAETGWTKSGGGLSTFFTRPLWQAGPGVINTSSTGFRQLPDVSAMSDPYSPGYYIYTGGSLQIYGGTSAAAPLMAAANTLIDQGLNGRTGQLTPILYQIGTDSAKSSLVYNDILQGNNGFYNCATNWDFVTGWGSPRITALYSQIVPTALGPDPPTISLLTPSSAPAGSPSATFTVTGTNFTASSKVLWNGAALPTQVVSTTALTATAPASLLLTVGTVAVTVTDPDGPTPAGPLTFTVTTPHTFAAGLQMISAPYDYTGVSFATLFVNPGVKIATWDPTLTQYVLNPTAPSDTFHLGRAYWVRFASASSLPRLGTPAAANTSYALTLNAGWNMIAVPFNTDSPMATLQVTSGGSTTSFASAVTAGAISGTLYRYDSTLKYYVGQTSGALTPYEGYWIYANHSCSLVFPSLN